MIHSDITGRIIESCFEVSNELGIGYVESVYENALALVLRQKGVSVRTQVPLKVHFRDSVIGDFKADLLIEDRVLVELKAVSTLMKEHYAQLLNYLKTTGIPVGMIVNFGTAKIQYRRFDNRFGESITMHDALAELVRVDINGDSIDR